LPWRPALAPGLVFLTKPDVFLALIVCVVAAFLSLFFFTGVPDFAAKSLVAFSLFRAGSLARLLCAFPPVEDWQTSAGSVVSAWVAVVHTSITRDPFYQWCLDWTCHFLISKRW